MRTIDKVSFSINSQPGVFALLLGSGVSRAASIPTGWEIVLDLISKLALLEDQEKPSNPYSWFREKFSKEPNYSEVVNSLGKTPSERNLILRNYFEQTEEEIEQNINSKLPTRAHRSIAKLVKQGKVKVIITTNFDRLLEKSLEDVGISPQVIASNDAVKGMMPLVHSPCTILKVNGDYLDTRIKNTVLELEKYEPEIESLLDQIFDSFGLIISGWSGEWDEGLRNALFRRASRRFSIYWASRGEIAEKAKPLFDHLEAENLRIDDADSFFGEIEDKVNALMSFDKVNPISKEIAVVNLKRLIPYKENEIKIHDLISNELKETLNKISGQKYTFSGPITNEDFLKRMRSYENDIDILLALGVNGVLWDKDWTTSLWFKVINTLLNTVREGAGLKILSELRLYPALLFHYAVGISLLHKKDFSLLNRWFKEPILKRLNDEVPALQALHDGQVVESCTFNKALDKNYHTPAAIHINEFLKPFFKEHILDEEEYDKLFIEYEILRAMEFQYLENDHEIEEKDYEKYQFWAPVGMYIWKGAPWKNYAKTYEEELDKCGEHWPPLTGGMFDGSPVVAKKLFATLKLFTKKLSWRF